MPLPAFAQLDSPPPAVALADTYYVLENRMKFIELRCFSDNNGTIITDPDGIPHEIVDSPDYGDLYWMGRATYVYVPTGDWTGTDTLTFRCGDYLNTATVKLEVVEDQYHPDEFVMPYGLGPPEFGIMEDVEDYEEREPEQLYYVNPDDQNATDTNNPNGSVQLPRVTIPTCLQAGAVVEVHGTSPIAGPLVIEAAGTEEAPIFIRGAGVLDRGTLRHGVVIEGNYVIFEYIDFDCSNGDDSPQNLIWFNVREKYLGLTDTGGWTGSHHVAIRHCFFMNHPTGQDGVAAMLFGATHCAACEDPPSPDNDDILIENCVVYDTLVSDFGDWAAGTTVDEDYAGVGFEGNSRNMWCLDSIFHHIQSTGIGFTRNNALSLQAPSRNCYAGRNVIHHVKEYGFNNKFTRDSIMSQNKIYGIRVSTALGAGMYIGNGDHCNANENASGYLYADNVWAIFNHIYDAQQGIRFQQYVHCDGTLCCCDTYPDFSCCDTEEPNYATSRVYAVGNVIHHVQAFDQNSGSMAILVGQQCQARLVNNTIYKSTIGVVVGCTFGEGTGTCPPDGDDSGEQGIRRNTTAAVWNNVFLDIVNDDNDAHIDVCTGPYSGQPTWPFTLTDQQFDRNLHYGTYRKFILPSGTYTNTTAPHGRVTKSHAGHNTASR